jgi:hypothetical protein
MKVPPPLLLAALAAVTMASTGCSALDEMLAEPSSGPAVVYVHEPSRPAYYDPYYNQPKYIVAPQYYTESKSKKRKGNKVTTTKTIRNEWGQTVYKEKTTKTKKKK